MESDRIDALDDAIAGVYRGPLEGFVERRDALARQLRADGRRDDASTVKSLRKPSRAAWALNMGALEGEHAIDSLVAAVEATVAAQASGGDVRAAIVGLRATVQDFAARGARAAVRLGQPVDPGALTTAVFAVLGKTESFGQLRRGRLIDVPEGGGLDLLTSLPVRPAPPTPAAPTKPNEPTGAVSAKAPKREALEAADAARRAAAAAVAKARDRAQATRHALQSAESKLRAAEERLRQAEEEVRASRSERDRARQEAEDAAVKLAKAEETVTEQ